MQDSDSADAPLVQSPALAFDKQIFAVDPEGNGQDRASLLSTLLRLDVDRGFPYAVPPDNGFAEDREARAVLLGANEAAGAIGLGGAAWGQRVGTGRYP